MVLDRSLEALLKIRRHNTYIANLRFRLLLTVFEANSATNLLAKTC